MLLVDTADSRWIPDSIVSGIPDTLSRIPELQILVFFFFQFHFMKLLVSLKYTYK